MANIKKKLNISEKLAVHCPLIFFAILCVIPIVTIVSASITNAKTVLEKGYSILPGSFDFSGYHMILTNLSQLLHSYLTSIGVTVIGTVLSLAFACAIAYPLSRRDFKYNNVITFIVFFTMLFNGGLVPWYILVTQYLHLKDHIFALILPGLFNPFYVLLMRTFMQKVPFELIESCKVDGLNEFGIFLKMIIPLSKPGIATVALFTAFGYWNDWFNAMLFINNSDLHPLQFMLYNIMNNAEALTAHMTNLPAGVNFSTMPKDMTKMAMCILAAGPMLMVFPFFQKYFVRGLTVGAIKG